MVLHTRTANADDAAAIDALLNAHSLAYTDRTLEPGIAAERIARPDTYAAIVTDDADRLIGFSHVWRDGRVARCFVRVHPEATGQGVGTAVLTFAEDHARSLGAPELNVLQPVGDVRGGGLLKLRGYTELSHILQMRAELSDARPVPTSPPVGVEVVPFDHGRDVGQIYATFHEAFPEDHATEPEWWLERLENPALPYDPELWFVAREGGELIGLSLGALRVERDTTVGYVGSLGVRIAERGRGIAYALLTATMAAFAERGLPAAILNVDAENLTGALRLYRKAGMETHPHLTEWAKQL